MCVDIEYARRELSKGALFNISILVSDAAASNLLYKKYEAHTSDSQQFPGPVFDTAPVRSIPKELI